MRKYIWYSPELDVFVLQSFMKNYYFAFEWEYFHMYHVKQLHPDILEPMDKFLWIPIGEL